MARMLGESWGWYGVGLTGRRELRICVAMKTLTAKQERFARNVAVKEMSLTDAYRDAYPNAMSDRAIWTEASSLYRNTNVARRIAELKEQHQNLLTAESTFDVKKLLRTYVAIALVDPNEIISQRVGACRHCWGDGGRFQWKEREYLEAVAEWELKQQNPKTAGDPMPDPGGGFGYRFSVDPNPECQTCEGEGVTRVVPKDTTKLSEGARLLYRGLQQTKEGVKILFADKDKALDQIGRIIGAYDDKLRVDIDAKIQNYKLTTTDPAEAAAAYQKLLTG